MRGRLIWLWFVACAAGEPAPPRSPPPADRDASHRTPADAPIVGAAGDAAPRDDADGAPFRIAAVGDLMLGSTYPDETGRMLPRDPAALLASFAPTLAAADIAFGNLEGPLLDGTGDPQCTPGGIAERNRGRPGATTCWAFRMPLRYGAVLRAAGLDVASIANNHVDDFGEVGRASTIEELSRLGIASSGPRARSRRSWCASARST